MAGSMRAIVVQEFGGPDVLEMQSVDVPAPGSGEVTIDAAFAGINFADLKRREGLGPPASVPLVPGLEVAGRIREVGSAVEGLEPGQEVVALTTSGAYAEVVPANPKLVYRLPAGLDPRAAASVMAVGATAYGAVHELGRLRAGERVLVQAAGGGVGIAAARLARAAGAAAVYGAVSTAAKAERCAALGYDRVFTYDTFAAGVRDATDGRGVDLAIETVGGEVFRESLAALGPFGRLMSIGNASGEPPWQLGTSDLSGRAVGAFGLLGLPNSLLRTLVTHTLEAAAEGAVDMPVTEFSLDRAGDAHRLMESRDYVGKLVLRIDLTV